MKNKRTSEEIRKEILKNLAESKEGLTISALSKKMRITSYSLNKEFPYLIIDGKIEMLEVGSSILVRLKNR
jgi:hypothetical protein